LNYVLLSIETDIKEQVQWKLQSQSQLQECNIILEGLHSIKCSVKIMSYFSNTVLLSHKHKRYP